MLVYEWGDYISYSKDLSDEYEHLIKCIEIRHSITTSQIKYNHTQRKRLEPN